MKKKVLALTLVLVLTLSTVAQAAGPARTKRIDPTLSFGATTVTCTVVAQGNSPTDTVSVTAKLWTSGVCKGTWTGRGTGTVTVKGSRAITKGATYTLTADVTINGVAQPTKSVTKTCP